MNRLGLRVAFLAALLIIAIAVGNARAGTDHPRAANPASAGVWFCPGMPPRVPVKDPAAMLADVARIELAAAKLM